MSTMTAPLRTPVRPSYAGIPLTRLIGVELRKMFDTRAGAWLMASIVLTATLASAIVITVAPDSAIDYGAFTQAIGFPLAIVLPLVAILSVTSEWSQRSSLSTFTLVPRRGRVVLAKGICVVGVGAISMLVAFGIGAIGNLLGSALVGVDTVWDASLEQYAMIVLANVLGVSMGFTVGVVARSSPVAIVGYFVYSLVLPPLTGLLAAYQGWFADLRDWVDFQWMSTRLFEGDFSGADWLHLGTSGVLWLLLPLTVGVWLTLRSEVK